MSQAAERRRAVEEIRRDKAEHDKRIGVAVPDTRKIEKWSEDVGRRADRQDRERKNR